MMRAAPRLSDEKDFMIIAMGLYQGFTALDAIGPYEVLTYLPGTEMVICAEQTGVVDDHNNLVHLASTRPSPMCRGRMCCLCPAVPSRASTPQTGPDRGLDPSGAPAHRMDNLCMHRRITARRRRAA